jgi:GGDEF domain-containing protein
MRKIIFALLAILLISFASAAAPTSPGTGLPVIPSAPSPEIFNIRGCLLTGIGGVSPEASQAINTGMQVYDFVDNPTQTGLNMLLGQEAVKSGPFSITIEDLAALYFSPASAILKKKIIETAYTVMLTEVKKKDPLLASGIDGCTTLRSKIVPSLGVASKILSDKNTGTLEASYEGTVNDPNGEGIGIGADPKSVVVPDGTMAKVDDKTANYKLKKGNAHIQIGNINYDIEAGDGSEFNYDKTTGTASLSNGKLAVGSMILNGKGITFDTKNNIFKVQSGNADLGGNKFQNIQNAEFTFKKGTATVDGKQVDVYETEKAVFDVSADCKSDKGTGKCGYNFLYNSQQTVIQAGQGCHVEFNPKNNKIRITSGITKATLVYGSIFAEGDVDIDLDSQGNIVKVRLLKKDSHYRRGDINVFAPTNEEVSIFFDGNIPDDVKNAVAFAKDFSTVKIKGKAGLTKFIMGEKQEIEKFSVVGEEGTIAGITLGNIDKFVVTGGSISIITKVGDLNKKVSFILRTGGNAELSDDGKMSYWGVSGKKIIFTNTELAIVKDMGGVDKYVQFMQEFNDIKGGKPEDIKKFQDKYSAILQKWFPEEFKKIEYIKQQNEFANEVKDIQNQEKQGKLSASDVIQKYEGMKTKYTSPDVQDAVDANLAQAYLARNAAGDAAKANEIFTKLNTKQASNLESAIKKNPGDTSSKLKLAAVYRQLGNADKAQSLYREVIQSSKSKIDNVNLPESQRFKARKDYADALTAFSLNDLVAPKTFQDKAIEQYKYILSHTMDQSEIESAYKNLGIIYSSQGDKENALTAYFGLSGSSVDPNVREFASEKVQSLKIELLGINYGKAIGSNDALAAQKAKQLFKDLGGAEGYKQAVNGLIDNYKSNLETAYNGNVPELKLKELEEHKQYLLSLADNAQYIGMTGNQIFDSANSKANLDASKIKQDYKQFAAANPAHAKEKQQEIYDTDYVLNPMESARNDKWNEYNSINQQLARTSKQDPNYKMLVAQKSELTTQISMLDASIAQRKEALTGEKTTDYLMTQYAETQKTRIELEKSTPVISLNAVTKLFGYDVEIPLANSAEIKDLKSKENALYNQWQLSALKDSQPKSIYDPKNNEYTSISDVFFKEADRNEKIAERWQTALEIDKMLMISVLTGGLGSVAAVGTTIPKLLTISRALTPAAKFVASAGEAGKYSRFVATTAFNAATFTLGSRAFDAATESVLNQGLSASEIAEKEKLKPSIGQEYQNNLVMFLTLGVSTKVAGAATGALGFAEKGIAAQLATESANILALTGLGVVQTPTDNIEDLAGVAKKSLVDNIVFIGGLKLGGSVVPIVETSSRLARQQIGSKALTESSRIRIEKEDKLVDELSDLSNKRDGFIKESLDILKKDSSPEAYLEKQASLNEINKQILNKLNEKNENLKGLVDKPQYDINKKLVDWKVKENEYKSVYTNELLKNKDSSYVSEKAFYENSPGLVAKAREVLKAELDYRTEFDKQERTKAAAAGKEYTGGEAFVDKVAEIRESDRMFASMEKTAKANQKASEAPTPKTSVGQAIKGTAQKIGLSIKTPAEILTDIKLAYERENYKQAIMDAEIIVNDPKVDVDTKFIAQYFLQKAEVATGNYQQAIKNLEGLRQNEGKTAAVEKVTLAIEEAKIKVKQGNLVEAKQDLENFKKEQKAKEEAGVEPAWVSEETIDKIEEEIGVKDITPEKEAAVRRDILGKGLETTITKGDFGENKNAYDSKLFSAVENPDSSLVNIYYRSGKASNAIFDSRGVMQLADVNIQDFKGINDMYGHVIGDIVIRETRNLFGERFQKWDGQRNADEFIREVLTKSDFKSELSKRIIAAGGPKLDLNFYVGTSQKFDVRDVASISEMNIEARRASDVKSEIKSRFNFDVPENVIESMKGRSPRQKVQILLQNFNDQAFSAGKTAQLRDIENVNIVEGIGRKTTAKTAVRAYNEEVKNYVDTVEKTNPELFREYEAFGIDIQDKGLDKLFKQRADLQDKLNSFSQQGRIDPDTLNEIKEIDNKLTEKSILNPDSFPAGVATVKDYLNMKLMNGENVNIFRMDVNDFSKINAQKGIETADVIRRKMLEISMKLAEKYDPNAKVFLMGGDEIAIVGKNIDARLAREIISEINKLDYEYGVRLDKSGNVVEKGGISYKLKPSVSIGTVEFSPESFSKLSQAVKDGYDASFVFNKFSDKAAIEAKANGKRIIAETGKVDPDAFFSKSDMTSEKGKITIENEINGIKERSSSNLNLKWQPDLTKQAQYEFIEKYDSNARNARPEVMGAEILDKISGIEGLTPSDHLLTSLANFQRGGKDVLEASRGIVAEILRLENPKMDVIDIKNMADEIIDKLLPPEEAVAPVAEVPKAVPEIKPAEVPAVTIDAIASKAGTRTVDELKSFADNSITEFRQEAQSGSGKLQAAKISDIKETNVVVDKGIVYLPAEGKAIFVGDTHGELTTIKNIVSENNFIDRVERGEKLYLVMTGDYVDRGPQTVENIEALLDLKQRYPNNIILLRGNHETAEINQQLSYNPLKYQLEKKYGSSKGTELWKKYNEVFNDLPYVAVTGNGIVALHGGIPEGINSFNDLTKLSANQKEQILWSDPNENVKGFRESSRGAGNEFGQDAFNNFMDNIGGKVLIRSHQYFQEGFKKSFDGKLITIFSAEYGRDIPPRYLEVDLSKPVDSFKELTPETPVEGVQLAEAGTLNKKITLEDLYRQKKGAEAEAAISFIKSSDAGFIDANFRAMGISEGLIREAIADPNSRINILLENSKNPGLIMGGLPAKSEFIQEFSAEKAEVPAPTAYSIMKETSLKDSFVELTKDTNNMLTEQNYQKGLEDLVLSAENAKTLGEEDIKKLVLTRAVNEKISDSGLERLEKDFKMDYESFSDRLQVLDDFAKILYEQDAANPGFANVHLARDGELTFLADSIYKRMNGEESNAKLLFASRDTLGYDTYNDLKFVYNAAFEEYKNAKAEGAGEKEATSIFYNTYNEELSTLAARHPSLSRAIEKTSQQMDSRGLFQNDKLRFIDTCCAGTINVFLEFVVKKYHPEIQTESKIIEITKGTGVESLGSGLKGGVSIEGVNKKGEFETFVGTEPVLKADTARDRALNYLSELIALKQTIEFSQQPARTFLESATPEFIETNFRAMNIPESDIVFAKENPAQRINILFEYNKNPALVMGGLPAKPSAVSIPAEIPAAIEKSVLAQQMKAEKSLAVPAEIVSAEKTGLEEVLKPGQSISLEVASIYMDQKFSNEQEIGLAIGVELQKRIPASAKLEKVLFADEYNAQKILNLEEYVNTISKKGFAPDTILLESEMVDKAKEILKNLDEKGLIKRTIKNGVEEIRFTDKETNQVYLLSKETVAGKECKFSCSLLDAAAYTKKLDKADVTVTVLPYSYEGQQFKTKQILKAEGYDLTRIINVYFDEKADVAQAREVFNNQLEAAKPPAEVAKVLAPVEAPAAIPAEIAEAAKPATISSGIDSFTGEALAVERFANEYSGPEFAGLKDAREKLPLALEYIELKKPQLIAELGYKDASAPKFNVDLSYLEWWTNSNIPKEEVIKGSMKQIDEILNSYFEIDMNKITKEELNGLVEAEKTKNLVFEQEKAKSLAIKENKLLNAAQKTANFIAGAAMTALSAPALVMRPIVDVIMASSSGMQAMILEAMMKMPSMSFPPGVGMTGLDMLAEKLMPRFVENKRVHLDTYQSFNQYVGFQSYDVFNPAADKFSLGKTEMHKYEYPTGDEMGRIEDYSKLTSMHTLSIKNFRFLPKGQKQPIPQSLDLSGKIMVPLKVESGEQLYYDTQGNLYIEGFLEAGRTGPLNIQYIVYDLSKKNEFVEGFISLNKNFFRSVPELNKEVIEERIDLGEEIESKIKEWQNLPTTQEKAKQVGAYIRSNFDYPYGLSAFTAGAQIRASEGRLMVEKIASAKIANCYDANKLGYVIMQRLGVPVKSVRGFPDSQMLEREPVEIAQGQQYLDPMISALDQTTTKVITMSHSFLSYYDKEKTYWQTTDFTPSRGAKSSDKTIAKDEMKKQELLDAKIKISQENGWKSPGELLKEYSAFSQNMRQSYDPIHFYYKSSGGRNFLVKNKEGYAEKGQVSPQISFFGVKGGRGSQPPNPYSGVYESAKDFIVSYIEYEKTKPIIERHAMQIKDDFNILDPIRQKSLSYLNRIGPSGRAYIFDYLKKTEVGKYGAQLPELKIYTTRHEVGYTVSSADLEPFFTRYLANRFVQPLEVRPVGFRDNKFVLYDSQQWSEFTTIESEAEVDRVFDEDMQIWRNLATPQVQKIVEAFDKLTPEDISNFRYDPKALRTYLVKSIINADIRLGSKEYSDEVLWAINDIFTGEQKVEVFKEGNRGFIKATIDNLKSEDLLAGSGVGAASWLEFPNDALIEGYYDEAIEGYEDILDKFKDDPGSEIFIAAKNNLEIAKQLKGDSTLVPYSAVSANYESLSSTALKNSLVDLISSRKILEQQDIDNIDYAIALPNRNEVLPLLLNRYGILETELMERISSELPKSFEKSQIGIKLLAEKGAPAPAVPLPAGISEFAKSKFGYTIEPGKNPQFAALAEKINEEFLPNHGSSLENTIEILKSGKITSPEYRGLPTEQAHAQRGLTDKIFLSLGGPFELFFQSVEFKDVPREDVIFFVFDRSLRYRADLEARPFDTMYYDYAPTIRANTLTNEQIEDYYKQNLQNREILKKVWTYQGKDYTDYPEATVDSMIDLQGDKYGEGKVKAILVNSEQYKELMSDPEIRERYGSMLIDVNAKYGVEAPADGYYYYTGLINFVDRPFEELISK